MSNGEFNLITTLETLNQIGARINRLGMGQDLSATLKLIAEGAVQAVAAGVGASEPAPDASTVIWIYNQTREAFESDARVSAGEPEGTSTEDYPRPDGLGMTAVLRQQRVLSYQETGFSVHPAKQAAGARSLAAYPLIANEETVGVLYVYRCDDQQFNEIELLTLENFVNLAAIAIHHGRKMGGLNRALARKVSELEKLNRASSLISSRTNLNETLQEILTMGLDMTAAQYGSFELYDKKRGLLRIRALAGRKEITAEGPPLPVNEKSVIGWVAANRQSLLIADLHDSDWREIYHPLPVDREMRSELAVPLIGAGEGLEGVLNIESPVPNAFTEEDRLLLEALATQAVIALQEIRLLDALQEITEVLLTAQGDDLFKLIIERACQLINVSDGFLWTISDTNTLVLRQTTANRRMGDEIPLDHSLTGQAIGLRQPITIENVQHHPDFLNRDLAAEQGWISAIIIPLMIPDGGGRAVGSLSLYSDYLRDFSDWDKKLLTCLANHAAVVIHDAEQLARLKEAQERQAIAETFAAVGDIAANLLHQLNNKVGAISARVQGIEDKCSEALDASPYLAHSLQDIDRSAQQAMAIVRDWLVHLRPVKRQPVNVAACLNRAIRQIAPPATVKIFQTGLTDLPQAMASEPQLELVFHNLIDNALKAMADEGELHLTGDWQENQIRVTVADTGPGISPDVEPHIFEFSLLATASKGEKARRLGFGLWWVKTFIDRFGGQLLVQNEPGRGAAFTICLPAK